MIDIPEATPTAEYLATVQRAVDAYYHLTARPTLPTLSVFTYDAPPDADGPHDADLQKLEDALRAHLVELHLRVYGLWDAIANEKGDDNKSRLERLAGACLLWIEAVGCCIENKYDTLSPEHWPLESADRDLCHLRQDREKEQANEQGPFAVLCEQDRTETDFSCHSNPELARIAHISGRVAKDLHHWATEKVTDDALRYYVYYFQPCESRLDAFRAYMDDIIAYWQYHNRELSRPLSQAYAALREACEKADRRFLRLSILPYWNDRDYGTPPEVQQALVALRDALARLTWTAGADTEKPQPPAPQTPRSNKGGRPSLGPKEAQRRKDIALKWEHSREKNVRKKDFCRDNRITVKYLDECLSWNRKQ